MGGKGYTLASHPPSVPELPLPVPMLPTKLVHTRPCVKFCNMLDFRTKSLTHPHHQKCPSYTVCDCLFNILRYPPYLQAIFSNLK